MNVPLILRHEQRKLRDASMLYQSEYWAHRSSSEKEYPEEQKKVAICMPCLSAANSFNGLEHRS